MPSVRKYRESDRERVQYVCLATSVGTEAETVWIRHILTLYCNYYIECEPDNVFVAVDDSDAVVGYILCSSDFNYFRRCFTEEYIPTMRCLGMKRTLIAEGEMFAHYLYRKKYPAHLHIDILPEYQKMGLGTALTNALFGHLREKGCPGIHLICDTGNEAGTAFYNKYGFRKLLRMVAFGEDFSVYGMDF